MEDSEEEDQEQDEEIELITISDDDDDKDDVAPPSPQLQCDGQSLLPNHNENESEPQEQDLVGDVEDDTVTPTPTTNLEMPRGPRQQPIVVIDIESEDEDVPRTTTTDEQNLLDIVEGTALMTLAALAEAAGGGHEQETVDEEGLTFQVVRIVNAANGDILFEPEHPQIRFNSNLNIDDAFQFLYRVQERFMLDDKMDEFTTIIDVIKRYCDGSPTDEHTPDPIIAILGDYPEFLETFYQFLPAGYQPRTPSDTDDSAENSEIPVSSQDLTENENDDQLGTEDFDIRSRSGSSSPLPDLPEDNGTEFEQHVATSSCGEDIEEDQQQHETKDDHEDYDGSVTEFLEIEIHSDSEIISPSPEIAEHDDAAQTEFVQTENPDEVFQTSRDETQGEEHDETGTDYLAMLRCTEVMSPLPTVEIYNEEDETEFYEQIRDSDDIPVIHILESDEEYVPGPQGVRHIFVPESVRITIQPIEVPTPPRRDEDVEQAPIPTSNNSDGPSTSSSGAVMSTPVARPPPPQIEQAIDYVTRIKQRFHDDPADKYNKFLKIAKVYQQAQGMRQKLLQKEQEAFQKVTELFGEHEDLVEEFKNFMTSKDNPICVDNPEPAATSDTLGASETAKCQDKSSTIVSRSVPMETVLSDGDDSGGKESRDADGALSP